MYISIIVMIIVSLLGWGLSVVMGITSSEKKLAGNDNEYVLSWNKKLLVVGVVIEVIGVALIFFMNSNVEADIADAMNIVSYLIEIGMALVFISICFRVNRFRIVVQGNQITVHPTFSKEFTCSFDDIASANRKLNAGTPPVEKIKIKTKDGKKFMPVSTMYSFDKFASKLRDLHLI